MTITDSPRIMALKREFRRLSEEDAALMAGALTPPEFDRLMEVRQRKLVIASEVFNHAEPTTNKGENHAAS